MGRADAGSTKAQSNAIKAKGLGRLRWYCQVCEKQCRDENGFQAHCRSEPHLRKIIALGPNAGSTIAEFSRQFQYEFVSLLKTRHNTQRVRANAVYNEYIQDKQHVHMNATRWVTLNGFIMTLGKAGTVKVDEDDKGLWIQWVDNTPATLAKQAALQKKERATMDGEDRERKMLEDQIARARAAAGADDQAPQGLVRPEGEKVSLSLSFKPVAVEPAAESTDGPSNAEASGSGSGAAPAAEGPGAAAATPKISFGGFSSFGKTPVANPLKANPLKRPAAANVFKTAKAPRTDDSDSRGGSGNSGSKGFMSEAERLMKEDQARRNRRTEGGYQGAGPRRGGDVRR